VFEPKTIKASVNAMMMIMIDKLVMAKHRLRVLDSKQYQYHKIAEPADPDCIESILYYPEYQERKKLRSEDRLILGNLVLLLVGNYSLRLFDPKQCQDYKIDEPGYPDCIESNLQDPEDQERKELLVAQDRLTHLQQMKHRNSIKKNIR